MECLFIMVLSFACVASATQKTDGERPLNIVFLIADDLGYGDIGPFGQTKIKTPTLDKLASQGMKLTRHYSGNAVCAPSRCVLMTGLHPGHAQGFGEVEPDSATRFGRRKQVQILQGDTTYLFCEG